MNFTRALRITILLPLTVAAALTSAQGQVGGFGAGQQPKKAKPFVSTTAPLPREVVAKPIRGANGRATVTPQTRDVTPNTATVRDTLPYWSKDEQFILLTSNRQDLTGTTAASLTHIYRTLAAGGNVTALTGPLSTSGIGALTSQSDAAFNATGSSIVYVDTDAGGGVDIVELSLITNTAKSLTKNNPNGFNFVGLNNPEYGFAIGGNIGVIFAGQLTQGGPYKLFSVDTQTGVVAQLTTGISDDRNPTLSPDPTKPLIAFDSNRTNANGTATKGTRDIWVIGINPSVQNGARVTNFLSNSSDNRHPSWSTNKVDNPAGFQNFVRGQQLLAFASNRFDPANDGNATAVNPNGSHDIYWLKVRIILDANTGSYSIDPATAESGSNPAFKLTTSDKNHIYDDLYPTWPQFITTYSITYQTDRTKYDPIVDANGGNASGASGQPEDIFTSTLLDLNAPTLVRYDDAVGDILQITPRISAPGGTVTIRAKVADFETGINGVYLQFKNPNSKYQSSDNIEHKVYLSGGASIANQNSLTNVPYEYESQRINAQNRTTYSNPLYIASSSDFFAFSGQSSPPDSNWLQMNFVSRDANTGVSTYEATWQTAAFPTDYYVDLIVYDNAVNPFTRNTGDRAQNWKIYDNIWGFSTQPFIAGRSILFVSDYTAGQKFFSTRGNGGGVTNVAHTFWGMESWMTDYDRALHPTGYVNGTTVGTWVDDRNTLGVGSYSDGLLADGTIVDGWSSPDSQRYDLWRILCRGAVPNSVLQQYLPRTDTQPADTGNGETNPRQVRVWDRAVVWSAPFTGNVFTGPGSLTDPAVQAQLHAFLQAGGRMVVNGQDIAWALTLDGTNTSSFVSNDLKATYNADSAGFTFSTLVTIGGFGGFATIAGAYQLAGAGAVNPISHDPWITPKYFGSTTHVYPGPPFPPGTQDFISLDPNWVMAGNDNNNPRTYASFGNLYPDIVTPIAPAVSDLTYGGGGTAVQHYADAASGSRVMYSPMGLEGYFPDSFAPPNTQNIQQSKNRRMEIMHNALCWMRSGTVTGVVLDLEGGGPIPNALVRLSNQGTAAAPVTAYTGRSGPDGKFTITGVEANSYEVNAVVKGFTIQKRPIVVVHGGFRNDLSFRMSPAADAVIKGKILRTDGVTPVVGATVSAKDNNDATAPVITAVSDSNGDYTLDRVPSQTTYTLTVTAVGFGESIPLSRVAPDPADPITTQRDAFIQAAKTYIGFDFQLKPEQGSATGKVLNNSDSSPIAGATVTATFGNQTVTAVTDGSGAYSFNKNNSPANGLDPGSWALVASAPGFGTNIAPVSVIVVSNQNTVAADIRLDPVLPGSVSGYVTRSTDGAGVSGVTVELRDQNGVLVKSGTTAADQTVNGYTFNFKIDAVPAGVTYTVSVSKTGFTPTPATRTATVTSNTETKNINFVLAPLHTFPGQLSMVSAPYDYNAFDVADLLSIPTGDRVPSIFRFGRWELQSYVFYPNPAASTFRLGKGYFISYTPNGAPRNMPLSTLGIAADDTRPFNVPLNAGWNMIGNPFTFAIDWTKVKVIDNGVVKSHDQAVADGAISSVVYGFVSGTYVLDFRLEPWLGYWVRALRNVTLQIDPTTDRLAGRAANVAGSSRAVLGAGDGWTIRLNAQVGNARDESTMVGVSSRASDAFDGFKAEKPPVLEGPFVRVSVDHPEWGQNAGEYGVDVRSAGLTTKSWSFSVTSNQPGKPITLTWPDAIASSRKVNLKLTDLSNGQVRDLRSASSYNWTAGQDESIRKFKLEAVAKTGTSDLKVSGLAARQPSRSSGMNVSYSLNSTADVEVRVLTTSGRAVRSVTGRSSRAAGTHQATWDLKDDKGISMPSGSYLVEVKAQNSDGQSARAVTQVITVR